MNKRSLANDEDSTKVAGIEANGLLPTSVPDPFLSSMTFAAGSSELGFCCDGCDECRPLLPDSIRDAVRDHKRYKRSFTPLRRSQVRTLMLRGESVAVWGWILPPGADPVVEFGNASVARLLWVRRLAENDVVKKIGTGVIGSSAEEKKRVVMNWVSGDVVLLPPSTSGIGWVVERKDAVDGPAEFVVAKVTLSKHEPDGALAPILAICQGYQEETHSQKLKPADAEHAINTFVKLLPKE